MAEQASIERTARVFNLQKYNMHDGPGVRSMAFFKGCPLRCAWCSNPESQRRGYEVMFKRAVCVNCGACEGACPVGIHTMEGGEHAVRRDVACIGCRRCEAACLQNALQIMGEDRTIEELLEFFDQDADFYRMSDGGITLSGGECLSQPEAAASLLRACRERGYHTAVETCGHVPTEVLLSVAEHIDLFLFDIKQMDPVGHKRWTGVNNELILANARALLEGGHNLRVRMPLLKGVNDSSDEIDAVIAFFEPYRYQKNFDGIDLLPYHKMGAGKYAQLDRGYGMDADPSLTGEDLARIRSRIERADFRVSLVSH